MPQMAIAQSIAIASLPSFSAQVAQGKFSEMRTSLATTLRGVLLLSLPASLGLIILRQPLIRLLYENGGVFNSRSTDMVSWALLFYAAGLVGHSVVEIISRAYYALHDTKTPVMVGVAAMSLNLVFSFGFSALFKKWGFMPHGGLALANSLATFLEMIVLLVIMHRKLGGLEGGYILEATIKAVSATIVMAAVLIGWAFVASSLPDWMFLLGGLLLGLASYALIIWLLKVNEFQQFQKFFIRKIFKK
jgi:putative peptidoglycan lipid II flippase